MDKLTSVISNVISISLYDLCWPHQPVHIFSVVIKKIYLWMAVVYRPNSCGFAESLGSGTRHEPKTFTKLFFILDESGTENMVMPILHLSSVHILVAMRWLMQEKKSYPSFYGSFTFTAKRRLKKEKEKY